MIQGAIICLFLSKSVKKQFLDTFLRHAILRKNSFTEEQIVHIMALHIRGIKITDIAKQYKQVCLRGIFDYVCYYLYTCSVEKYITILEAKLQFLRRKEDLG